MSARPTAALIVIGDEILSGKFVDENAGYALKELRALGVAVRRIEVIPDDLDEIATAVRAAADRFDHVFTSGGIGPTHDDLTMEGVARAFGVPVVRHPELEAYLRRYYGEHLEPRNLRMADAPAGAVLVPADHPQWPVTSMKNVYILPGIPLIFRRKLDAIKERFRHPEPFHLARVYCLGEEGTLAAALDAVVAAHPGVSLGSYPRIDATDFRVLITLEASDATRLSRAVDDLIARLPPGLFVRAER
jgi:molybdenum cofactor synthesis domain-containing protein